MTVASAMRVAVQMNSLRARGKGTGRFATPEAMVEAILETVLEATRRAFRATILELIGKIVGDKA
ncbi:hypothetical protein K504DRAFT_465618 [Pleomassaria siparia CBS 279.74]|uniref:Uncharacterized protein n=1 Tax=Pleomassaria siparia CBS 279.74 TaxID=1314801 RepID=A0A6G1KG59_9PLEO|nr:hypothetical protein K504DRAFT_465618 [Pleomassaria siparia CBS 279.74]